MAIVKNIQAAVTTLEKAQRRYGKINDEEDD